MTARRGAGAGYVDLASGDFREVEITLPKPVWVPCAVCAGDGCTFCEGRGHFPSGASVRRVDEAAASGIAAARRRLEDARARLKMLQNSATLDPAGVRAMTQDGSLLSAREAIRQLREAEAAAVDDLQEAEEWTRSVLVAGRQMNEARRAAEAAARQRDAAPPAPAPKPEARGQAQCALPAHAGKPAYAWDDDDAAWCKRCAYEMGLLAPDSKEDEDDDGG